MGYNIVLLIHEKVRAHSTALLKRNMISFNDWMWQYLSMFAYKRIHMTITNRELSVNTVNNNNPLNYLQKIEYICHVRYGGARLWVYNIRNSVTYQKYDYRRMIELTWLLHTFFTRLKIIGTYLQLASI